MKYEVKLKNLSLFLEHKLNRNDILRRIAEDIYYDNNRIIMLTKRKTVQ